MKCPTCNVMLATAERTGVEIDYCPKCWGIWLDRGELNLLIDRADWSPLRDPRESAAADPLGPQTPSWNPHLPTA